MLPMPPAFMYSRSSGVKLSCGPMPKKLFGAGGGVAAPPCWALRERAMPSTATSRRAAIRRFIERER